MGIKAYKPALSVKLIKLVKRTQGVAARYSPPNDFDLTPFLGEVGGVRTSKSIREPAGGFSISFADKKDPTKVDTVYALVEPMDMIEIRASRTPEKYSGQELPIIMRGFVTDIMRDESMSADGTPQRVVVLTGHDFGYFWLINQIIPELLYITDIPYLTQFRAQASTGIDATLLDVSDFMKQLTGFVNTKIEALSGYSCHVVSQFTAQCTVTEGQVAPNLAAAVDGPLWNFADRFSDGPWNELFTEDAESGPLLIFRPVPYHGLDGALLNDGNGNLTMQGAVEPGTICMDISTVVAMSVRRTDRRIANFFWTAPGASLLDTNGGVALAALVQGTPIDTGYANNKPELYAIRKMPTSTALFTDAWKAMPSEAPTGQEGAQGAQQSAWHLHRMAQLRAANRDNAVFEEGAMTVQGIEALKIGRYLQLTRGSLVAEYYITSVAHNFAPLQTWTTQVQVERGTGFLARNKMQQSPYLIESRKGPY